jgi:phytoene/squalene synthetase
MADSPLGRAPGGSNVPRGADGPQLSTPVAPTNALSSERYLAWLYSPQVQQPVLTALCQIEAEVAASLRQGIEHHVAHARLQWWREECERAARGRPAHPLTRSLVRALGGGTGVGWARPGAIGDAVAGAAGPLTAVGNAAAAAPSSTAIGTISDRTGWPSNSIEGISGFVDTAVWDLAGATFETRKELTAYCERWATAMFGVAAAGLGAEAAHAARSAHVAEQLAAAPGHAMYAMDASSAPGPMRLRALGAAVREVELLAGLAREAHAGRLRVPLDELERAGVDASSLAKAPWPTELVNLLRERHESLRKTIASTVSQFSADDQASIRGLLVWAELAWRLSRRAQRALPNVVLPRRYHVFADGWHAWRAAHRAGVGRLRLN